MGHTYTRNFIHLIFSTKERRQSIPNDLQNRLWKYLAAVANENHASVLAVGGVTDHVHMLLAAPAACSLSDLVSKVKGSSSRWMRGEKQRPWFGWQEGYGAFSVSASHVNVVTEYIRGQEDHHKKHSFEDEFLALLKRYGVKYDPKYVLG